MTVHVRLELVSNLNRNYCPSVIGIGVQVPSEYAHSTCWRNSTCYWGLTIIRTENYSKNFYAVPVGPTAISSAACLRHTPVSVVTTYDKKSSLQRSSRFREDKNSS